MAKRVNILGVGVHATSLEEAVETILAERARGGSGYVCVTSVHGVMESQRDEALRSIHNRSLLTVPDGMPTVWMGQEYGFVRMGRVYGPDLMLEVCGRTVAHGARDDESVDAPMRHEPGPARPVPPMTHFLYGSTEDTLAKLRENLERRFPGIRIVGTHSPPFRPLTDEEERTLQEQVAACAPDFFWVGLSTPKQERFMAAHCPASEFCQVPLKAGILIGVGAAFDIHSGNSRDAPDWVKQSGLQWFYRLCKEPRRLWRRYLWIVPGFLWRAFFQVLGIRRYGLEISD
jgi:N-acetylglucosaminyldiphosphoundecaprenol N-acetyl-beta-D-mannosaminyltransferase